jgi:hypothetical protein
MSSDSTLLGIVIGIVLTAAVGWITTWFDHRREDHLRFVVRRQEAYATFLGLLDRMMGDDENDTKAKAVAPELATAYGLVDVLAPKAVCDLATDAHAVAWRAVDDPLRVSRMEALVRAMRKDLGVSGDWAQRV